MNKNKKNIFLVAEIALVFLFLFGCGLINRYEPELSYEKTEQNGIPQNANDEFDVPDYVFSCKAGSSVLENEGSLYVAKSDGIYKFDKSNKEDSARIYTGKRPQYMLFYKSSILFTEDSMEMKSIDIESLSVRSVFMTSLFQPEEVWLSNTEISGDIIYFGHSAVYYYNLADGSYGKLIEDVSMFGVYDSCIYYIDHVERTGTIYKYKINSGETSAVHGGGKSEPEKDIYNEIAVYNGNLFYSVNMPRGFYADTQNGTVLLDDNEVQNIYFYNEELYYISYMYDNVSAIYKFNVNSGKKVYLDEIHDYAGTGFIVNSDGLFYNKSINPSLTNNNGELKIIYSGTEVARQNIWGAKTLD